MRRIKYTKELIEPLIKDSISYKEVIEKLGITYTNGTTSLIHKLIKKYNIDIKHFYNHSLSNKRKIKLSNEEMFIENSNIGRSVIRGRILSKNLLPYNCEVCGCCDIWQGVKMPFILDHKNGINTDNRLENLRWLCSNCDSIQPTYKSKNQNTSKGQQFIRNKIVKKNEKIQHKLNKEITIQNRINQIKNSNVEFIKIGWRIKVGKLMNWTPQYAGKFIKENIPTLFEICYKHNYGLARF